MQAISENKIFEDCYTEIHDNIDEPLNVGNVISFMVLTMEIVEKYRKMNGLQKKRLVLHICNRVVEETEHYSNETKESITSIINTIGPTIIDAIIFATKGKLILNAKNRLVSKLSKCC